MTIHSFDDVLRAGKSLHAVQLTPGGKSYPIWRPVPWIACGYFVGMVLVFIIAAKLPILGVVKTMFAPAVYYAVLPALIVWLMFFAELDGIAPHKWFGNYARFLLRPKRMLGGDEVEPDGARTTYVGKVAIWWDFNCPRLHRGWVTGGRVRTTVPVRFTHAFLHTRQVIVGDDRGVVIDHEVRNRLQVRP